MCFRQILTLCFFLVFFKSDSVRPGGERPREGGKKKGGREWQRSEEEDSLQSGLADLDPD